MGLFVALAPVSAQEQWKRGQVRDLAFAVPASWHFIFDQTDGVGGYTPDATRMLDLPIGISVLPGKLAEAIPAEAIARTEMISLDGHPARRYEIKLPAGAQGRPIMVDIEEPGRDGKPLAISLTAPIAEWGAWQPVLERILNSVRFETDLSSFVVPDLAGAWYVDGRSDHEAEIRREDRGAYFSVDGNVADFGDERFDVVRLDPYRLAAVGRRAGLSAALSPDGLEIAWSDGTRWSRAPRTGGPEATSDGTDEPAAAKRVSLGALSAEVPASWPVVDNTRGPLSARYAISPRRAGLAGLVAIDLAGRDPTAASSDYVAEASATLLQGGRALAGGEATGPWDAVAQLEGVMVWGEDGAQPTEMEIRSAGHEGTLYVLMTAWPAYAGGGDIEIARKIASSGALGARGGDEQPESVTEQLLFDGALGERWRPLSVAGGNFDAFARIEQDMLVVDVPEGNGWGKTGIWTHERLVKVPSDDDRFETILTFTFDPGRSSDIVVALGGQDNPDEWGAHSVRVGWSRDPDASSSTLTLWVQRGEVMKTRLGPDAPQVLTVRLRPGGLVIADIGGGGHVEGVLPSGIATESFGIYALAHAPASGKPAKMVLISIASTQMPLDVVATSSDPSAFLEEPQDIVLFDGTLGQRWVRHSAAGGNFEAHGKLRSGELAVDVPADASWGKVGIFSPEPLVWLDRFGEGGSASLTFRFDPDRTSGFVVALAAPGWGGVPGNDPGNPSLQLHWRRVAEGSGAKATLNLWPQYKEPLWEVDLPEAAPEEVKIVLSPDSVRIYGPGLPEDAVAWDVLAEGQGFRVWAYSHPDVAGQPVKMALTGIRLQRIPGMPVNGAPEPGVEPLPVTVLFDGTENALWEASAVNGGDFQQFARFENAALVVDAPEGHSWAWTGLLSAEPVLTLDERVWTTPTRLAFKFDPQRSDGFRIAVAGYKAAEMWSNGHDAWVTLAKDPADGSYLFGLHQSPYQDWSRRVDAAWTGTAWDGTLTVDFGHQWIAVCLAGGPCVRGTSPPPGLHAPRYMTVFASAWKSGGPARMALKRIERSILTPPGMTALERFDLVDDEDFDPVAFLQALGVPPAQ